jgi:hypothetical protein
VTVVSRDNDEGLVEDIELLELLNGSTDSVVELEKVTKSTVVVKSVHLLVDRGSLGHEEETLVLATGAEDIDRLEGHLLETGQVSGITLAAGGVVVKALEVVLVDVAVEPDGEVALAEDTEGLLALVSGKERGLVHADGVSLLLELLVVVLALERLLAGKELLGTATEEDIGATVAGPGVVGVAVESLVNQRTILATGTGVASEGNGGGISEVGSRDSAPSTALGFVSKISSQLASQTYPDTLEDLDNGLDLGVIERIGGRVSVYTEARLACTPKVLSESQTP